MKTSVLILAAGPYRKGWTKEAPKQMTLITGEPLVLRTLRQLKECGHDENVTVITHNEVIQAAVPRFLIPLKKRFWHETLSSASALWSDRTIVLDGDTVYSDVVLSQILAPQLGNMFYGEFKNFPYTHIHAISFTNIGEMAAATKLAAKAAEGRNDRICTNWGLYHMIYDLAPYGVHLAKEGTFIFQPEDDYTRDLDSVNAYKLFCATYKWAAST